MLVGARINRREIIKEKLSPTNSLAIRYTGTTVRASATIKGSAVDQAVGAH